MAASAVTAPHPRAIILNNITNTELARALALQVFEVARDPAGHAQGAFDLACLCFGLGQSVVQGGGAGHMLAEMRRLAPLALLVDWRLPERNLDVPAATLARLLRAATGRQNRHYEQEGALEGVLYRYRNDWIVTERACGLGGALGLALAVWR